MYFIRIPYRVAIPVRALPFVAGTEGFPRVTRLPPSLVVQALHQACDAGLAGTPNLRAYALKEGKPATVDPMYLDAVAPISDFCPESDEPIRESFSRLPAGMFVFADDLRTFIDWLFPPGSLNGQCREAIEIVTQLSLPEAVTSKIYQGFEESQSNELSANGIAATVGVQKLSIPDALCTHLPNQASTAGEIGCNVGAANKEPKDDEANPASWIEDVRAIALEYIAKHKAGDLFPSQADVCSHAAEEARKRGIYGSQLKPLSERYIQRNAIQGDWWKKNRP